MTTPSGRRIAVNPISFWSKAGKTKEVFEEAFADFAKIATAPSRLMYPTAWRCRSTPIGSAVTA
ncbi:MAG TPA: hypothetical protein VFY56_03825 [Propionibacteriaceae bacterium]|nr:hypothetical protein [Propionibacteriaceae bacterium]